MGCRVGKNGANGGRVGGEGNPNPHTLSQVGLWMLGLGIPPTHLPTFTSVLECTAASLVLFDLPASLTTDIGRHIHTAPPGTSHSSSLCTTAVRERNAEFLLAALRKLQADPTRRADVGPGANAFALASALALNCSAAITALEEGVANAVTQWDRRNMEPNLSDIREVR